METCALVCYTKQQTILAQKHSGTKITLFRPQYAIKVPFEKCRNWCPNVSHKNLSSSKSVHRSIYSCSFQNLQWGIWITAGFFFPGWYIKVCLVFYLHPLITSTLHKIRGCCDAHCYVCFCSSNGYTEDGQNSQYSILMTKDLWDYNSNLGHLLILPFVQLLCLFRMQKQKDRIVTHPAQKEFKFCLTPCTTL